MAATPEPVARARGSSVSDLLDRLDLRRPGRDGLDVGRRDRGGRAYDDLRQRQVLLRDQVVGGNRLLDAPADGVDLDGGDDPAGVDRCTAVARAVEADDRELPACATRGRVCTDRARVVV